MGLAVTRRPASGFLAGLLSDETIAQSAMFLEKAVAGEVEEDDDEAGGRAGEVSGEPSEDEIRSWLGAQAAELPPRGCRLDFLEIFTGEARITQSVIRRGGRAIKIGLQHGQDLRRRRDRRLLLALIYLFDPHETWISWPCTAFCAFVALNESRGVDLSKVKRKGARSCRSGRPNAGAVQARTLGCR